jgi:glycosyltransferase involved in cell wall biosynthesis
MVSIIIPLYNGARFIAEALGSILAQTFTAYELLIIDDGSTDESATLVQQIMQNDPRLRYHYQPNGGVTTARNQGIRASRGDLIAFLDQDDRWMNNALACQVAYHQQHPAVGYTLAHQICFLEPGCSPPAWFQRQTFDQPHIGYLPGTLVVKRAVFEEIGLFDPAIPISSDADWFARASDAQIPMGILPQVLLERRIHNENQSQQSKQIQRELFHLLHASIKRKQRDHTQIRGTG